MTLTLYFQIFNLLYLREKWSHCYETKLNIMIQHSLKRGHSFWPCPLSQTWPNIKWKLGIKFGHYVYFGHDLYLPWIFKVKYSICYISGKKVWSLWNEKPRHQFKVKLIIWLSILTPTMILTLEFYKVEYSIWHAHPVLCLDIFALWTVGPVHHELVQFMDIKNLSSISQG